MKFEDILLDKKDGVARITINRPQRMNSFTGKTSEELVQALYDVGGDRSIGVAVITGAGDRAFCSGGDVGWEEGGAFGSGAAMLGKDIVQTIVEVDKPIIARVNGYAIGGGHVIQVVCDLSIASETARFGQVGPRVGSFHPGWGIPYLARVIGQKKAREMWMLCRQYTAQQALQMGLVNAVVPPDKLDEEVQKWCNEILALGPSALRAVKLSFNTDIGQFTALHRAQFQVLGYIQQSEEAKEGQAAFREKRKPDFSRFRK